MIEPQIVGTCRGCEKPVVSGEGVRTDPQGGVWHTNCRLNRHNQTSAGPAPAQDAPKRRGRPPKPRPEQDPAADRPRPLQA